LNGDSNYKKKDGVFKSGIMDIRNWEMICKDKDRLQISLIPKPKSGKKKTFVLHTASKEETESWINAFTTASRSWNAREQNQRMDFISGYLVKEGHKVTNLKHRFFILKSDSSIIYYYKSEQATNEEPLGTIELKNCEVDDTKFYNFGWFIKTIDDNNKCKPVRYLLKAKTKEDKVNWLKAIRQRHGVKIILKNANMLETSNETVEKEQIDKPKEEYGTESKLEVKSLAVAENKTEEVVKIESESNKKEETNGRVEETSSKKVEETSSKKVEENSSKKLEETSSKKVEETSEPQENSPNKSDSSEFKKFIEISHEDDEKHEDNSDDDD